MGQTGRPSRVGATSGRILRFALVGGICTLLYLVLFVCFRLAVGAQVSNVVALLISAVVNTALNRRITFRLRGPTEPKEHASGLAAFGLGAALTGAGLAVLHATDPHVGRLVEVVVLLGASVVATLVRYVLFQRWVFASALAAHDDAAHQS